MAGYYSTLTGNTKPNPATTASSGVCPSGSYCPQGTSTPNPCPAGTYNDQTGGESLNDCLNCPAGYYCAVAGKTMAQL